VGAGSGGALVTATVARRACSTVNGNRVAGKATTVLQTTLLRTTVLRTTLKGEAVDGK
jgi:hypothetical protein